MGDIPFDDTAILGEKNFDTFGCNPYAKNPDTPDFLRPDVEFTRGFRNFDLDTPDGDEIRIWSFRDEEGGENNVWPAPTIRYRAGEIAHSKVKARKGTHTIHHHGIDATPFNVGVGHTSFEVNGNYVYQFQSRYPGTYFFHCHKNTVLHFEMGMYGALIVDEPEGPGFVRVGDDKGEAAELQQVDVEAFWVCDELDQRYRELNQNAGLCGEDEGLNLIKPDYFAVSGVLAPETETDRRVRVAAKLGDKILIRLLNAAYAVLRTTLPFDAKVISVDGRSLGGPFHPWSKPFTIKAGEPFELVSAQRYDILIDADRATAGTDDGEVVFEFLDWIREQPQDGREAIALTFIDVS